MINEFAEYHHSLIGSSSTLADVTIDRLIIRKFQNDFSNFKKKFTGQAYDKNKYKVGVGLTSQFSSDNVFQMQTLFDKVSDHYKQGQYKEASELIKESLSITSLSSSSMINNRYVGFPKDKMKAEYDFYSELYSKISDNSLNKAIKRVQDMELLKKNIEAQKRKGDLGIAVSKSLVTGALIGLVSTGAGLIPAIAEAGKHLINAEDASKGLQSFVLDQRLDNLFNTGSDFSVLFEKRRLLRLELEKFKQNPTDDNKKKVNTNFKSFFSELEKHEKLYLTKDFPLTTDKIKPIIRNYLNQNEFNLNPKIRLNRDSTEDVSLITSNIMERINQRQNPTEQPTVSSAPRLALNPSN